MALLTVESATKRYGKKLALDGVSFSLLPGSVTGFLGPNGAGKSTTMNALMGFIGLDEGTIRLFDKPVGRNSAAVRRRVGFLASDTRLDGALSVREEIALYDDLAGGCDPAFVAQLIDRLGIDVTQKIDGLSTGNYQKVALVLALMHQPELLILDEPTNGLDPLVQAECNKIIRELAGQGSTVLVSSHIMSEVQELCEEYIFIKKGKIIETTSRQALLASAERNLHIRANPAGYDELVGYLEKHHLPYQVEPPDLEELFLRYYQEEKS